MPSSPSVAGSDNPAYGRSHLPRQGRAAGVPLYTPFKEYDPDTGKWAYVPSFPLVFVTKGFTYGKAWEVFDTHYLQRGLYGPKALMRFEHYGCWLHMQFLASHGEKFYAADMAANTGVNEKTVIKYLDHLENLRLIRRVRNGASRDRFISVLLLMPVAREKMRRAGPELMQRVLTNAVDQERKAAGAGRWPLHIWDADMIGRHLRGEPDTVARVGKMQDAIGVVARRFNDPGYNDAGQPTFEDQVKTQCAAWHIPFSPKLYMTAMTWRRLNAKLKKEAPL